MAPEKAPVEAKEKIKQAPKEGEKKDKVLGKEAKSFLKEKEEADRDAREEKGDRMLTNLIKRLKESSIVPDLIDMMKKTKGMDGKIDYAKKQSEKYGEKFDLKDQAFLFALLLEITIDGDTDFPEMRVRRAKGEINSYDFSKIVLDKKMATKISSVSGAELAKWKGIQAIYNSIFANVEKTEKVIASAIEKRKDI